jgi:hypothetical protein
VDPTGAGRWDLTQISGTDRSRSYGRPVTVLRPPFWQRVVVTAVGTVLATLLVVGGMDDGGWMLPACLFGSAVTLAGTWRQDRIRVELGQGVVVVNFWRTLVLPWAEIERFGYDSGAWVRRRDRRQHAITAFSPPAGSLPFVERAARQAVQAMEDARKRRRR